ncbi:MAG: DnaJ family domain-containing protein [Rubrivivax sp.]|jgi:hypothetical protein
MSLTPEERRERRLQMLDDHIGQSLRDSEASGELQRAASYGKPLDFGDGFAETPDEFKTAFKMLKDAGYAPPEVELMREITALEAQLAAALQQAPEAVQTRQLQTRCAEKRQVLALALERLRFSRSL